MRSAASFPAGLLGLTVAGLLAAFMSNFAATVNAAPPYFVNDIYKRFINPDAAPEDLRPPRYLSSFLVVVIGILIGWNVTSVNSVVLWIVSGLWGGYTASNVLKWYWWRFNGYGYFWGMITGITSALVLAFPGLLAACRSCRASRQSIRSISKLRSSFRWCWRFSLVGCLLGTFLTKPEDDAVLMDFYSPRQRPWGFWGPVLKNRSSCRRPRLQAEHGFLPRHVQHRRGHRLADLSGGAAAVHRVSSSQNPCC
jgi:solute:Na+ symporter, SSS family